jgi:hypothetical protein
MPSNTLRGSKYLIELISSRCGPDLLTSGIFPNAKEVTESFGAYAAARKYLSNNFRLDDPKIHCVCVGDGCTPRTAATFAFRSRWTCWSIDPKLKMHNVKALNKRAADRVFCRSVRIEDFELLAADKVVIVSVHSHANLMEARKSVSGNDVAVIAIPCCVAQDLDRAPDVEYRDGGILSPCNLVKVWQA